MHDSWTRWISEIRSEGIGRGLSVCDGVMNLFNLFHKSPIPERQSCLAVGHGGIASQLSMNLQIKMLSSEKRVFRVLPVASREDFEFLL